MHDVAIICTTYLYVLLRRPCFGEISADFTPNLICLRIVYNVRSFAAKGSGYSKLNLIVHKKDRGSCGPQRVSAPATFKNNKVKTVPARLRYISFMQGEPYNRLQHQ